MEENEILEDGKKPNTDNNEKEKEGETKFTKDKNSEEEKGEEDVNMAQDEDKKGKDEEDKENGEKNEENESKEKDDNENKDKEEKMDIDSDKDKNKENEEESMKETHKERSTFSLEGAKQPISLYTRRVMDISKIDNYLKSDSTRGRCGGRNLGNTCFMNSSIACLSNCTELTYYFLKGDYKKDINEENTLGMKGELAKSWGDLLHQYWVDDTSVGDPSDFKYTIGRKAVRFRGYGQQDSNEFMSVFLDYLNEDLNRTTKKEYIEMKEKGENESDEECAKRYWECNLKRNDSIITDLFCGQFKSTITCPECGWINITFDPFDTINLPLLTQVRRNYGNNDNIEEFKFYYVTKYCLRNPYCIKIKNVLENEFVKSIIDRIKKEKDCPIHDKLDELYMIDMYNNKIYGNPEYVEHIKKFNYPKEYVVSFNFNKKNDDLIIPVFFFKDKYSESKENMSIYARMVFGKKNMSIGELKNKIYLYLRKYILSPLLKENEEKDNVSLEIEKYIEDKNFELNDDKLIELIEKEYQEVFKSKEEEEESETKMDEDDKSKKDEKENKNKDEENKEEKMEEENNEEKKDDEKKEEKKDNEKKEENESKKEETKDNKEPIKDEKESCIERFKKDMPFKIYIKYERDFYNKVGDIPLVDEDNFSKLSEKIKEHIKLKSFNDTFENLDIDLSDYQIIVEFKEDSKYINKETFDLDSFNEYELEYKIKKEEPKKKEEEEEDDGKMTLAKCLKKFCKEEQLEEGDEWYCSKCKKHVLAKKKMEFFYLPKILIICFKRFVKDSYRWEKNEDEVDFPINDMDMKDFVIGPDKEHSKYDLFAVSQHYGSTGFGHYTAVCKNNGQWFSYNDSSCHETSENDALSSAAYVLFYRRQTD